MKDTRSKLLDAAYQEVRRHGFQGMRIDEILAKTGAAKGSLYHHFRNKEALGYAVVDEAVRGLVERIWIEPLRDAPNPIDAMQERILAITANAGPETLELGCPLNNLSQEMSCLDPGFRQRLNQVYAEWMGAVSAALRRGQEAGNVRPDVDSEQAAAFIVAAVEGGIGLAKNAQDAATLAQCGLGLSDYLETLRAKHDAK